MCVHDDITRKYVSTEQLPRTTSIICLHDDMRTNCAPKPEVSHRVDNFDEGLVPRRYFGTDRYDSSVQYKYY